MKIEFIIPMVSAIIALISTIISALALYYSNRHQKEMRIQACKQSTIEAFNKIQNEVLDKLIDVPADNAKLMVRNLYKKECKESYNAYKVMIARLEHFAVGIDEGVYDKEIVEKLAGSHLIFLYDKIEPIIKKANENSDNNMYYCHFTNLIKNLKDNQNNKEEKQCLK